MSCPNCGYCKECGRSNYPIQWQPVQPNPYIIWRYPNTNGANPPLYNGTITVTS